MLAFPQCLPLILLPHPNHFSKALHSYKGLLFASLCIKMPFFSQILDVPDGHRAPVPLQRGAGDALLPRLEYSSSSCSSLSLSPSPSAALGRSPHTLARAAVEEPSPGALEKPVREAKGKGIIFGGVAISLFWEQSLCCSCFEASVVPNCL